MGNIAPHPFGRLRTGLTFSPREKGLLTHPLKAKTRLTDFWVLALGTNLRAS
jgi:hypothetical protein